MLIELAGCIAREVNYGPGVTKAASKLVSDTGGSADDSRAIGAASGNSGKTVQGTGTVNPDKVTVEPTTVTVQGKANQTNWDTTECVWTSLLVGSVSYFSSFE